MTPTLNVYASAACGFETPTLNELFYSRPGSGRTSYQNVAQTTRKGVEVVVDSRWAGDFTTRIAYSGLVARYAEPFVTVVLGAPTLIEAGRYLPGIPGHTLFGDLVWRQPAGGWHAGIEAIARSKVYVEDSNTPQAAPAYAIANLSVGFEQRRGALRYGGFLRLDNVFDRQYAGSVVVSDANGRYYEAAPGRNWLAGFNASYSY